MSSFAANESTENKTGGDGVSTVSALLYLLRQRDIPFVFKEPRLIPKRFRPFVQKKQMEQDCAR